MHGTAQQAPLSFLISRRAEQKLFAPAELCGLHVFTYLRGCGWASTTLGSRARQTPKVSRLSPCIAFMHLMRSGVPTLVG
eukprot:scaffold159921_cov21-Tisochrysis_lutea.AAC.1